MKLLILLSTLEKGGMGRAATDLSEGLSELYQVNLAYFKESEKNSKKGQLGTLLKIPKIAHLSKFSLMIFRFAKLLRFHHKESFNVIICSDPSSTLLALMLKVFYPSIKILSTCQVPKSLLTKIDVWIISNFYNKVDSVIAPTKFIACELNDMINFQRSKVIPIALPRQSTLCKWPPDPSLRRKGITFAGRLAVEKNPLFFIQMAELDPKNQYYIFGEGDLAPLLKQYIAQKSIENILLFGWKEMSFVLQSSKLLVMPSLTESFGIVAIEAWANGVPTLVSTQARGTVENLNHKELGSICDLADGPKIWVEAAKEVCFGTIADETLINIFDKYDLSMIALAWQNTIEEL